MARTRRNQRGAPSHYRTSALLMFVIGIGILLRISCAKGDLHSRLNAGDKVDYKEGLAPVTIRMLHIRRLQRQLREGVVPSREVYAVTAQEAEEKIIQKLVATESYDTSASILDDRTVSVEWAGLCQEKLSPSEREALKAALTPLQLPAYELSLAARAVRHPTDENLVKEEAHRVIQATLGGLRYRDIFRECRVYQQAQTQFSIEGRIAILYRVLGFTADQQKRMSLLVNETIKKMYPPFDTAKDDEEYLRSSTLDERGLIPELHVTPESSEGAENEAMNPAPEDDANWKQIEADFRKQFYDLITEEQRGLIRKYRDEIADYGYIFDPQIDGYIISEEAPHVSAESTSHE